MPKANPQRSCLACRETRDKGSLLRLVLAPDGAVVPDLQQKLPGRGAYTCMKGSCLKQAAQKRQFGRGFKTEVAAVDPEGLARQVVEKLEERIASYLSLANKAGKIVSGSDQAMEKLKKGGAGIMFLATDISADIGEKFRGVARLHGVPCVSLFTKERLGALLGKELRSVLVVTESGFVGSIELEMEKYRNFFEEERE
ncbi:COG2740: Predicted nucleic-acid-binding protein implicated in transcription termination / Ribosomal protein L7Ae family protein YlxQ [Citrifermentans bremense]|uniref:COG2740: Predicted nucleic-acid-binding protein implicated in transcription termination / Ribosomal protein L7Ae family protein YlxQ n=1 Tax=Citrifermentans bremense TaxID=60035 RepID=A0A6S6M8K3_9BACT|nr:DUF448 domain-containing protein [Citrifermentans bremense]BCG48074.1 COG2740: Predicted nucleic-acid-binding protein implicated in transcription termination / Ribosomal protein L7Ae family protein YlxQ [Citrifermentans bremense]